ncbi:MAG: hypothetical protein LBC59_10015 [Chitinispirillales bacterium]|jgi:hypothetical protein|nr:hypothetical protein [Chitinispirillales bacterium]
MNRFTLAKFGRTLLFAAVAAVISFGCGSGGVGGGDNPANNNTGGNNGGDATHDGRLITGNGEAWVEVHEGYSCASPREGEDGIVFKSNGDALDLEYEDGVWKWEHTYTWQTNGNKLTFSSGVVHTYEVSNNSLTMVKEQSGRQYNLKKCGGLTIVDAR